MNKQPYLDALEIPGWKMRATHTDTESQATHAPTPSHATPQSWPETPTSPPENEPSDTRSPEAPPAPAMASPTVPRNDGTDTSDDDVNTQKVITQADENGNSPCPASNDDTPILWQTLQAEVSACKACDLHETRTQTVFGTGNRQADWLIIGEAPGADEDRQGEPFVGRAGRLLNAMIEALGFRRESVYIANILKCRPPNNRDPSPREASVCETFLLRQIQLVKPKVILAVGRIAAQNLLATTSPIGRLRGRRFVLRDTGIPLVVTYHPAYLLRSPLQKRRALEDLMLAHSVATGEQ